MVRVEGLSAEEKKAVGDFLAFMAEAHSDHFLDDAPRLALESYWSTGWARGQKQPPG
jgi:hypothetical protein